MKKLFNKPYIWILLGLLVLAVAIPLTTSQSGRTMVDTNVGMAMLQDDKAAQARVVDGDQRVDLTLREPYKQDDRDLGKEVYFYFATARATDVVTAVDDSALDGYTDEPVRSNWFLSLLGFMVPFLLIALLFWFLTKSALWAPRSTTPTPVGRESGCVGLPAGPETMGTQTSSA